MKCIDIILVYTLGSCNLNLLVHQISKIFAKKLVQIYSFSVQVYCSVMGWMDFRACGSSTFQYVLASMNPKFLLSSGSMSEDSLNRVAGWCCPSSD